MLDPDPIQAQEPDPDSGTDMDSGLGSAKAKIYGSYGSAFTTQSKIDSLLMSKYSVPFLKCILFLFSGICENLIFFT
jgi:hypothetical protein